MKVTTRAILDVGIVVVVAAYVAVCLHSVQEIHYLKSFFPRHFTVEEAFYAAATELIKVIIIGLPIIPVLVIYLTKLRESATENE
jgi:hypothetical protein